MTFPALLHAAETASSANQGACLRARACELVALAAAAGVGELSYRTLGNAGPIAALVLFAVALVVRVSNTGDQAEKRWYDARAASESIKSAAWQFAVGGEAFRIADDMSQERFSALLQQILKTLPDLDVGAARRGAGGATAEMTTLRRSPQPVRAKIYFAQRVQDQVEWYSAKAAHNKARASLLRWVLIFVEASACVLGLLRALKLFDVNWLGVLAAVAAGIAAWKQTKKYSELSESYAVTSHEVNIVASTIGAPADEPQWAQAVHDAEAAFSREHTLWLARRQGP